MREIKSLERWLIVCIVTALLPVSAAGAEQWEPGRIETAVYAGFFDTAATSPPAEVGIEVRRTLTYEGFSALAGVTGNEDSGAWIYGGARYDLHLAPLWTLAPGFAVTLYDKGDGKELGQTLEFRSSIELARRINDRVRLGFTFYHLSNASMSATNPGANSAVVSVAFRRPSSRQE